jgi:preprotein translocase subunit SecD
MPRPCERPRSAPVTSALFGLCLGFVACGPSKTDESTAVALCLDAPADASCTDVAYGLHNGQIAPTFDEIFMRTLQPSCGSSTSCHAGAHPQNGLSLDDAATAYTDLMSKNAAGTEARVIPNDLKCGELIVRLETANEPWSMPKAGHLPDNLLCVIRHWIADGAPQ